MESSTNTPTFTQHSELYDFILLKKGILKTQTGDIEESDHMDTASINMFYITTVTYLYGLEMVSKYGKEDVSLCSLISFWLVPLSVVHTSTIPDEIEQEEAILSRDEIVAYIKDRVNTVLLPYWEKVENPIKNVFLPLNETIKSYLS